MKNLLIILISGTCLLLNLSSCRNKTVVLLTRQWDCTQVENIIPPGTKLLTATDSADAAALKTMLHNLNWTFTHNMRYECSLNCRVTVQGKFGLLQHDSVLICTSVSTNTSNRYIIRSLNADELVLAGNAGNTNVVLHFKPH